VTMILPSIFLLEARNRKSKKRFTTNPKEREKERILVGVTLRRKRKGKSRSYILYFPKGSTEKVLPILFTLSQEEEKSETT